ncbi:MAG: peptidyl-prolyl cis-trans isomerase C [Rhodothermales bacterium]|jgi:peptidyl-prolyl cis-trans isomerase C
MTITVNDEVFEDDAIYRELEALKQEAMQRGEDVNCCERDSEFMPLAQERLIAQALVHQQALADGIEVADAEVETALAEYRENYGEPEEVDAWRERVARNLRTRAALAIVCGDPDSSDDALRAFYDAHIQLYMNPRRVRVSHIIKRPEHGVDSQEQFTGLCELRKQLQAGANFAEIASAHSDMPEEGGDLGAFAAGEFDPQIEAIAFSLDTGEISPVFLTSYGFHIATVTGIEEPGPIPFDDVQEQIREDLVLTHNGTRTSEYVESLKAKAKIEEKED